MATPREFVDVDLSAHSTIEIHSSPGITDASSHFTDHAHSAESFPAEQVSEVQHPSMAKRWLASEREKLINL